MSYSVTKNYIPVKTVDTSATVCPVCNIKSPISMTFYQVQAETSGGIQNTKIITATCYCNACKDDIPNLKWTKELHDFFKTEKKKIVVKRSFKLKRGGKIALWALAAIPILLILLALFALIMKYFIHK